MKITYTIKQLAELTGVKAHTIRAWEKRYRITCPIRNCNNVRSYSEDDLKTLTNVALLSRHGMRISKIAKLGPAEIAEQVTRISAQNGDTSSSINTLGLALKSYDASKVECLLQSHIDHVGLEKAMQTIFVPLLHMMGLMHMSGTMNETSAKLFHEILEQKVRSATDALPRVALTGDRIVLFSTGVGVSSVYRVYFQYIARKYNKYVIPLGNTLTPAQIEHLYLNCDCKLIVAIQGAANSDAVLESAITMNEQTDSKDLVIFANGFGSGLASESDQVHILDSLDEALQYVISPLAN